MQINKLSTITKGLIITTPLTIKGTTRTITIQIGCYSFITFASAFRVLDSNISYKFKTSPLSITIYKHKQDITIEYTIDDVVTSETYTKEQQITFECWFPSAYMTSPLYLKVELNELESKKKTLAHVPVDASSNVIETNINKTVELATGEIRAFNVKTFYAGLKPDGNYITVPSLTGGTVLDATISYC